MKPSFWLILWIALAALICLVANAYTASPLLDFSPGHLVISGLFSGAITLACFVIFTLVNFLVNCLRNFRE